MRMPPSPPYCAPFVSGEIDPAHEGREPVTSPLQCDGDTSSHLSSESELAGCTVNDAYNRPAFRGS